MVCYTKYQVLGDQITSPMPTCEVCSWLEQIDTAAVSASPKSFRCVNTVWDKAEDCASDPIVDQAGANGELSRHQIFDDTLFTIRYVASW